MAIETPIVEKLEKLSQKLLESGPEKIEATPKRVRGVLNQQYVFDTTKALYVWEHQWYPTFYVPVDSLTTTAKLERGRKIGSAASDKGSVFLGTLTVKEKTVDWVLILDGVEGLDGMIRVDFPSLDKWFIEDEEIFGHPKNPYVRVDCIPSSREVRVEVDGVVVAKSANNIFLFETLMHPRYYLSATSVNWEFLTPSNKQTYCPYKGEASYYHVTVKGKQYDNMVWWYKEPMAESAPVAGRLCFYNERVNIFLDGEPEP